VQEDIPTKKTRRAATWSASVAAVTKPPTDLQSSNRRTLGFFQSCVLNYHKRRLRVRPSLYQIECPSGMSDIVYDFSPDEFLNLQSPVDADAGTRNCPNTCKLTKGDQAGI